jgi:ornithine decarboxylase
VKPYYAVKCNNNPILLGSLAQYGAGFDCASLREVREVRALPTSNLPCIFAHPCKIQAEIKAVQDLEIDTTVIDSPEEITKLKANGWKGSVLVRLLVEEKGSVQPFGSKFGAPVSWWPEICRELQKHNVPCSGFSFHVGSECKRPENFYKAIGLGSEFVNLLAKYQTNPITTIDIGGGFLPDSQNFLECSKQIEKARGEFFNPKKKAWSSVKWIAEPGRYFGASFFSLYAPVIGKKRRLDGEGWRYTINESIYGSFSNIPFDHQNPVPKPMTNQGISYSLKETKYPAEIYGRTCDSGDCLGKDFMLPELKEGDWLQFENMGAYTIVTASEFNGFPRPEIFIEDL